MTKYSSDVRHVFDCTFLGDSISFPDKVEQNTLTDVEKERSSLRNIFDYKNHRKA